MALADPDCCACQAVLKLAPPVPAAAPAATVGGRIKRKAHERPVARSQPTRSLSPESRPSRSVPAAAPAAAVGGRIQRKAQERPVASSSQPTRPLSPEPRPSRYTRASSSQVRAFGSCHVS